MTGHCEKIILEKRAQVLVVLANFQISKEKRGLLDVTSEFRNVVVGPFHASDIYGGKRREVNL